MRLDVSLMRVQASGTRTREAHRQHDGQLAGGNPCWQQATKDVSRVNENKLLACE